jgi:hypothetical protein
MCARLAGSDEGTACEGQASKPSKEAGRQAGGQHSKHASGQACGQAGRQETCVERPMKHSHVTKKQKHSSPRVENSSPWGFKCAKMGCFKRPIEH